MKFILSLPPTTNQTYKIGNRRMYVTGKAKDWKTEAQWKMRLTNRRGVIGDPVELWITYYLKYDRDVDNSKILIDSLEDVVVVNDKLIKRLHIFKEKDKNNPRVEIVIEKI